MRRAARRDGNHAEVRDGLRELGFSVADTGSLGGGFPDLVVGTGAHNVLLEIKDGSKPPSERKLTPKEQEFIQQWDGPIYVVESLEKAAEVCLTYRSM